MILSLKIENFRSIKEPLTVDFRATKRLSETHLPENTFLEGDLEVLKSLMIYGRNASGKSNILLALDTIVDLVTESDSFKHNEKIDRYEPFLFDERTSKQAVKLEIDFISVESKVRYTYFIQFTKEEFIKESLVFYPGGKKAKLFERDGLSISYGDYYKGARKRIQDDLLPNQLFLSKSASSRVKYLDDVYLYFLNYIYTSIFDDIDLDLSMTQYFTQIAKSDKVTKQNFLLLLNAADTNITDFKIIEHKSEISYPENWSIFKKYRLFNKLKNEILTYHSLFEKGEKVGEVSFLLEEESLGTKKLFAIGGLILETLNEGGVIVIDELDKGFHPLLSKMIIELFNSKKNNPKNAQLIFATHDSALLDLDILRRDQISFVDKEYEGNSIFYKLSDIKGVRKDTPIDKWYLSGRFGAIPVLGDVNFNYSK